ncbi:MAG TPA: UDP-glucose 4-epimerase GalE [Polyangia bacterium]|nr:UDP-glucose 4-epimerase GalE [Polyangia bacterium]
MRIFVTGGAGYIGSHVCKALARAGHEPITFDNLSTGHRWAVKWGPLVVGDLGDAAGLKKALADSRAEAVMHFAASAYVGVSVVDPRAYYANNFVNGKNLLDAMVDVGVKSLVFSSTCAIFGDQKTELLDEDHPQNPVNPYGETKRSFERAIHWYGNAYGLRSACLRYFNAAGADPDGETGEVHDPETHLIPIVLAVAAGARSHIDVFGDDYPTPDGTCVRDYIHVLDLASAHVLAIEHLHRGGPSLRLNLGTGQGSSVSEVVAAARRVTGAEIPVRVSARRAGDPARLVADGRASRATLKWTPTSSDLDTILRTAWAWARKPRTA